MKICYIREIYSDIFMLCKNSDHTAFSIGRPDSFVFSTDILVYTSNFIYFFCYFSAAKLPGGKPHDPTDIIIDAPGTLDNVGVINSAVTLNRPSIFVLTVTAFLLTFGLFSR